MIRLGIDNGLDGSIVGINAQYAAVLQEGMPLIPGSRTLDLPTLFATLAHAKMISGGDIYAVLEYAQVMPKQGAVSGFTIGRGYGAMQMALIALGIPHAIKRPREWQSAVGIVPRRKPKMKKGKPAFHATTGKPLTEPDRRAIKAQSIAIAQRRLPTLILIPEGKRVPQDGLADAGNMALVAAELRPFGMADPDAVALRASRDAIVQALLPPPPVLP